MSNQENKSRFAVLESYSTQELEEILRGEILSADGDDDALIFRILEVMEAREASPDDQKEKQVAWERFQTHYCTLDGEGQSLYVLENEETSTKASLHTPRRRIGRTSLVAAVLVAIMIGMVTVQAAGVDIFGTIARWTEERFFFISPSEGNQPPPLSQNHEYTYAIQDGLNKLNIPAELAPTWFPKGYEMEEVEATTFPEWNTVYCSFVHPSGDFFFVQVDDYSNTPMSALTFEKDSTQVEIYVSQDREFHIFSNLDTLTATWSDGQLVHCISGSLTKDELTRVIDSIGV